VVDMPSHVEQPPTEAASMTAPMVFAILVPRMIFSFRNFTRQAGNGLLVLGRKEKGMGSPGPAGFCNYSCPGRPMPGQLR
jgi:hypothetical protein